MNIVLFTGLLDPQNYTLTSSHGNEEKSVIYRLLLQYMGFSQVIPSLMTLMQEMESHEYNDRFYKLNTLFTNLWSQDFLWQIGGHIDGFNDNLFNYHYNRKYQTVFKDHSSAAENLKKTRQPRSKQDIKTLVWSVVVIFYFFMKLRHCICFLVQVSNSRLYITDIEPNPVVLD